MSARQEFQRPVSWDDDKQFDAMCDLIDSLRGERDVCAEKLAEANGRVWGPCPICGTCRPNKVPCPVCGAPARGSREAAQALAEADGITDAEVISDEPWTPTVSPVADEQQR